MRFCEFSYQTARYASELCARRSPRSQDKTPKWWSMDEVLIQEIMFHFSAFSLVVFNELLTVQEAGLGDAVKRAMRVEASKMFDEIKVPELPRIRKEVKLFSVY